MKYNEISHFSHPQHKLKFDYSELPFKCDGCREIGIGSRYRCSACDYDLHTHCALPSPSFSHPFYTKCSFQDVCGFLYHCRPCGFDLHPCCAKLPAVLDDGEIKLYLHRRPPAACGRCGRKGRGWSYRSACKKYCLHVGCVKEILAENWQEIYVNGGGGGKAVETRMPSFGAAIPRRKGKGKAKKCCEVAGMAVQFVVSAVLGDPTTLIAGVVGSMISK
ncbi:hypothetical protein NMG60_11019627 [Bertholletia excelsa]